ncbi:3628_t:CDS:2 [Cetraspora pellucida]|uniref:Protein ARV n=1 Tax=Cetraspora pellucida TaxID=1433469 RepID=A0A9N9IVN0_9GLOM|nr:3628_t:CDS:2 [Cetraspora pellucida]
MSGDLDNDRITFETTVYLYFFLTLNFNNSKMPICVECGVPVANLYTEYSTGIIRLTHCVFEKEKQNHKSCIGQFPNSVPLICLEFVVLQFGIRLAVFLYISDKYAIVNVPGHRLLQIIWNHGIRISYESIGTNVFHRGDK